MFDFIKNYLNKLKAKRETKRKQEYYKILLAEAKRRGINISK